MIVLLAIQEKTVAITDAFNPTPITGKQSIFNRQAMPTEQRLDVEIIGVYSKMETAQLAREGHAKSHPGRRYLQKVAQLDGNMPGPPVQPKCITCGTPIGLVGSFCPPCQKAHFDKCNGLDPRGGEGDLVPVRRTNVGYQSTILNGQT